MPFSEITTASENDLNVHEKYWSITPIRTFFDDKIYINTDHQESMKNKYNSKILTPIKAIKDESLEARQRDKAANDLFSKAVASVRHPIESVFNWLIKHTDTPKASKVRSTNCLSAGTCIWGTRICLYFSNILTLNLHIN